MKRLLIALLFVAVPAIAHEDRISLANLPSCTAGSPTSAWVLDSVDDATCDPEQTGTSDAHCCCANGTWAACSSGSGGSGDIEAVWATTSGTVDALTAASGDSLDAGSADASSPATRSTSLPGTCSEGQLHQDTDSGGSETYVCTASNTWTKLTTASDIVGVSLDLGDDGGGDSSGITEIATIYDRYGIASEPSADKLLIDFAPLDDRYLAGPPASPATPDDEFNAGTLDGKWTVVDGTSGTVDPHLNTTGYNVYDLATRSGFLLIQVGGATGDDVLLRQDYELPDGSTAILMFDPPSTSGANSSQCGINVNDTDTGPQDGNYFEIIVDQNTDSARFLVQSVGATSGGGAADMNFGTVAIAITRVDSGSDEIYAGWASLNGGRTWLHVDSATHTTATLNNLWVFCDTRAAHESGQNDPVAALDWLRVATTTNLYSISF